MLCTNRGLGQSVDCPVQTVDPCFVITIHGFSAQTVDPHIEQHKVRRHKLKGQDAIEKRVCIGRTMRC